MHFVLDSLARSVMPSKLRAAARLTAQLAIFYVFKAAIMGAGAAIYILCIQDKFFNDFSYAAFVVISLSDVRGMWLETLACI